MYLSLDDYGGVLSILQHFHIPTSKVGKVKLYEVSVIVKVTPENIGGSRLYMNEKTCKEQAADAL